ncbi:LOW QUALITY PROTEIN: hypothetical protein ACG7TL_004759 [Trametes sanguinea]
MPNDLKTWWLKLEERYMIIEVNGVITAGMLTQYLFVFAQVHDEFRIPELQSVAEIYGFDIKLPDNPEDRKTARPFMVLGLESEEHVKLLARRCVLIKYVCEFYARGRTYEELHQQNRIRAPQWQKYADDTSFKFLVTAFNHTIPQWRQRDVVESFAYMDFQGKIDMKNPEITLACFEEYRDKHGTTRPKDEGDGEFEEVWFGRLIETGSARPLVKKFDVKKRAYYGNTSMEAEMSLLMANQTLAAPGKLVYDPLQLILEHFSSDRISMVDKCEEKLCPLVCMDADERPRRSESRSKEAWAEERATTNGRDPASARTASSSDAYPHPTQLLPAQLSNPRDDQPYIPPTRPYELSELARDLVLLARYMLRPRGRLVFFLPTVTEEYKEVDIEAMLCGGMEVVANSLQDFGSWGRRLITIRKTTDKKFPPPTFDPAHAVTENVGSHVPAHKDFREKYFQGFKKGDIGGSDSEQQ